MSQTRKQLTLAKLGWVCAKIEDILAGQDITLADIPLTTEAEPGETPLERLQRFKALLSETLAQINRGEPRQCAKCQEPIPDPILDDMPWATTCPECGA